MGLRVAGRRLGRLPRTLLFFGLSGFGFGAYGLHAQNLIEAQILGQPLVYMKAGKLDGCGIRLIVVDMPVSLKDNNPIPVWDLSFNMYLPGRGAVKIGSYNVSAAEMRIGKPGPKSKVATAAAAAPATTTKTSAKPAPKPRSAPKRATSTARRGAAARKRASPKPPAPKGGGDAPKA